MSKYDKLFHIYCLVNIFLVLFSDTKTTVAVLGVNIIYFLSEIANKKVIG